MTERDQPQAAGAQPRTVLVAIGGNSLIRAGEPVTMATQRAHAAETCRAIVRLASDGWRVIVTHGNGPQVGAALRRSEVAVGHAYPLPLDVCVASTQGEIGILLQQALDDAFESQAVRRPVATVLTQVVVSVDDPAFAHPAKPVGRFYSAAEAQARRESGWTLVEEPHGFRRVVPSPEPIQVVEEPVIGALADNGVVVIALGGGGVPVVRRAERLEGVEAVVDKDLASSVLAVRLRVNVFVMSTDVNGVYVNFARPDAVLLHEVTAARLRDYAAAAQFPAGTMGPKVEAALRFVDAGGGHAIVTSPDRLIQAIEGRAGTRIVRNT